MTLCKASLKKKYNVTTCDRTFSLWANPLIGKFKILSYLPHCDFSSELVKLASSQGTQIHVDKSVSECPLFAKHFLLAILLIQFSGKYWNPRTPLCSSISTSCHVLCARFWLHSLEFLKLGLVKDRKRELVLQAINNFLGWFYIAEEQLLLWIPYLLLFV